MELKWYQSEATHEVGLLDTSSSPTTVFLRRNITKITKKVDEESEETYDVWQYEEAKVSHEQFEEILSNGIASLEETTTNTNDALDTVLTEELPAQDEQIQTLVDTVDDILTNVIPSIMEG